MKEYFIYKIEGEGVFQRKLFFFKTSDIMVALEKIKELKASLMETVKNGVVISSELRGV